MSTEALPFQDFSFTPNDFQLFRDSQLGNQEAYQQLYNNKIDQILHFTAWLDSDIDYELLRLRVFETSWRLLIRVEDLTKLPRFCRIIALNIIRNDQKKKKILFLGSSRELEKEYLKLQDPSDKESPELSVLDNERCEILWREVKLLPEEEQKIIISRFVHDETFDKMAIIMGVSKSTLFERFKKIMEKLAKSPRLRDYFGIAFTPILLFDVMSTGTFRDNFSNDISTPGLISSGMGLFKICGVVSSCTFWFFFLFFAPIIVMARGAANWGKSIPNSQLCLWFTERAVWGYSIIVSGMALFFFVSDMISKLFPATFSRNERFYYGSSIAQYVLFGACVIYYLVSRYYFYQKWRNISSKTPELTSLMFDEKKRSLLRKLNIISAVVALGIIAHVVYYIFGMYCWPRYPLAHLVKYNLNEALFVLIVYSGCHWTGYRVFRRMIKELKLQQTKEKTFVPELQKNQRRKKPLSYTRCRKNFVNLVTGVVMFVTCFPLLMRLFFRPKDMELNLLLLVGVFTVWLLPLFLNRKRQRLWPYVVLFPFFWLGIRLAINYMYS